MFTLKLQIPSQADATHQMQEVQTAGARQNFPEYVAGAFYATQAVEQANATPQDNTYHAHARVQRDFVPIFWACVAEREPKEWNQPIGRDNKQVQA